MASNRQVSTAFWTDSWVETLKPAEKLLFLYLLTNPQTNVAGVYEVSLSRVVFESGIDQGAVAKALDKFAAAGKVLYVEGWVIVRNFQKYQNQESPHIKAGIERIISILPETVKKAFDTVSIGSPYPIQALSHSYSDSDSDSNLDSIRLPAKTPERHTEDDKVLAKAAIDAMESRHGPFANYAKEWKAGYRLVAMARARWPDAPGEFLSAAIGEFWQKRQGGWMQDKPFTPSMLSALWEHVIEGLRDKKPDDEELAAAAVNWGRR